MPINQSQLDEVALSRSEYEAIVDRLGRDPNELELGLFGSLWSEHCGYKHSKPLLRTLPGKSDRLLVSLGTENAGVVDVGDGLAIAMKIESHNHPSAIEPHAGAATGVGGIVRDIFAMGARPIALLNSLRFGKPDNPRNRYLLDGVVSGISSYGNCLGIPNVGGEVVFASSYDGNPLVNAMCVGLVEDGHIMSARAEEPGDVLLLVGSDTGRDGIHGASMASTEFDDNSEEKKENFRTINDMLVSGIFMRNQFEPMVTGSKIGIHDIYIPSWRIPNGWKILNLTRSISDSNPIPYIVS